MKTCMRIALLLVGVLSLFTGPLSAQEIPGDYIVVMQDDGAEPLVVAQAHGLAATHRYDAVFHGFAAHVPPQALDGLRRNPHVAFVEPDRLVYAYGQSVPTGVSRMGAYPVTPGLTIAAGIAIIDTGIDLDHSDLYVVGGVDCRRLDKKTKDCLVGGDDDAGHGTHVAGIAAALDNAIGVVGVAPGAPLFAVKVLGSNGSGTLSGVIQGMDWVARNAAAKGIVVANLSLGGLGWDDTDGNPNGCAVTLSAEHKAICAMVAAGVTVAVAAGNEMDDAANHTPGAFDEVITVSSLADFDGLSGGLGSASYSWSDCTENVDDSFTCFSNYGHDVDIMAPGVAIYSTYMGGGYATMSGTSMASPHVAGAVALLAAQGVPPQEMRAMLLASGEPYPCATPLGICLDDPDGIQEPLVMVGPSCETDADCDDALVCNGYESCVEGACVPGEAVVCDDGVFCNGQESCVESGFCVSGTWPCDDGAYCTADDCDESGDLCLHQPNHAACDDSDDCTIDTCQTGSGCTYAWSESCVFCGDGVCNGAALGETCLTCSDCACIGSKCKNGCCGNGVCDKAENASGCPVDCL